MPNDVLQCRLQFRRTSDDEFGLQFIVANSGPDAVEIGYLTPFLTFDLEVSIDGSPVEIVEPAFDGGTRFITARIARSEELMIETPIRLAFDPHVPPSGGPDRNRWSLVHPPAPARVTGIARVEGAQLEPFAQDLDPRRDDL